MPGIEPWSFKTAQFKTSFKRFWAFRTLGGQILAVLMVLNVNTNLIEFYITKPNFMSEAGTLRPSSYLHPKLHPKQFIYQLQH